MKLAKFSAKLVANFRRSLEGDFRVSFAGKIVRSTKTPPQISPSNFTTRFWVVAGPKTRVSVWQPAPYGNYWVAFWELLRNYCVSSRNPFCSDTNTPCPIRLDDRCTGQWKRMEEVPRCTSLVPLAFPCFVLRLIGGNRRAFRLPGAGGYYFHCTVEPSPGHIRCQNTPPVNRAQDAENYIYSSGPPNEDFLSNFSSCDTGARWLLPFLWQAEFISEVRILFWLHVQSS